MSAGALSIKLDGPNCTFASGAGAPSIPAGGVVNTTARGADTSAVTLFYQVETFFKYAASLGLTPQDVLPVSRAGANKVVLTHNESGKVGQADWASGLKLRFGPADVTGTTTGYADDGRVVWHELVGHGTCWDAFGTPNLGFSHSFGDAVAALRFDPDHRRPYTTLPISGLPVRFHSFPWFGDTYWPLQRRHDHAGWWNGTDDGKGYDTEQLLSTTFFNAYRAMGGDSVWPSRQRRAAGLFLRNLLTVLTATTSSGNPSTLTQFLSDYDACDSQWVTAKAAAPTIRVLREAARARGWNGAPKPNSAPGALPAVDVYADDGRGGAYTPTGDYWWTGCDAWNRHANDGLPGHQVPIAGVQNFLNLPVHNRGTTLATGVTVKVYEAPSRLGATWPSHWSLRASSAVADIPAGGSVTLANLTWTPTGNGFFLVRIDAIGDKSVATDFPTLVTQTADMVRADNNMVVSAVRPIVAPLPGTTTTYTVNQPSGWKFGLGWWGSRKVEVPSALAALGWSATVAVASATATVTVVAGLSPSALPPESRSIHLLEMSGPIALKSAYPVAGCTWLLT